MISDSQRMYTGGDQFDLAVGSVRALRQFYIGPNGKLIGHWNQVWPDGEFVARCLSAVHVYGEDLAYAVATKIYPDAPHPSEWTVVAGTGNELAHLSTENYFAVLSSKSLYPLRYKGYYIIDPCDGSSFEDCACGFYGVYGRAPLARWHTMEREDWVSRSDAVAVVEHYGKTVLGERGLRSRKARILGVAASSVEDLIAIKLEYPSVRVFRTPQHLLREIPVQNPLETAD